MKFTLAYDVEDHGWAIASLQCSGERYDMDAISYLSDAFSGLSQAVLDILEGRPEAGCGFDHEPGRTKLRFINQGAEVMIQVYEFDNELKDEPWEKGECVKSFQTRTLRLKSQYLDQADRILQDLGVQQYQERWGYPFPVQLYERIKTMSK